MASRWEKLGKRLLFAPFALRRRRPLAPIDPARPPGRVLILRADDRIGNLVLLLPLVDAIRRAWPDARIDMLLARVGADLVAADARLDRIIVFDKRELVDNWLRIFGVVGELRRDRYDLVIDASHPQEFSLTGSMLTGTTRARRRVGYLAGASGRVLDAGLIFTTDPGRHQSEVFLDLLRLLVPDARGGPLSLPIRPDEAAAARARLVAAGGDPARTWIGIHPGGRGPKRWPVERFRALAGRLAADPSRQLFVFQGPGEEAIVRELAGAPVVVVPRLPVRSFAAALAPMRVVIAGDTGPMHLAQAVGPAVLALFLAANHRVFGPSGPPHRVLYDPGGLSVERVAAEAEAMLAVPAAG
jgi:ADP-heptose:LPS heptosyltransferase